MLTLKSNTIIIPFETILILKAFELLLDNDDILALLIEVLIHEDVGIGLPKETRDLG